MKRLHQLIVGLLTLVVAPITHANTDAINAFPEKTIRIVVPWAPGGFTDSFGRMLAEKMSKSLDTSVIVENRPGASGSIGASYVSRSNPDGYTLLLATSDALVYAINTNVNPQPTYNPANDFDQISLMATQPVFLASGKDVPAQNLQEFVTLAKKQDGKLAFGSSGEGSAVHLAMETFSRAADINMVHIPYKGINPALIDVLAGRVHAIFISYQGAGSYFKTGEVRPLAVTSLERSLIQPDVPTIAESGYPDFQLTLWYAMVTPRGTPPEIIGKLNKAVNDALAEPDLREILMAANTTPVASTPDEADTFLNNEIKRWSEAVEAAKKSKTDMAAAGS